MPPKLVPCRVSARHPITLAGGRPAAHGDVVDVDPDANRAHIASGALRPLPIPKPKPKPKPAPRPGDSTQETA